MPANEALPARVPIMLYRGDTRVWDDAFAHEDGQPVDLTGYTFAAQIREAPDAETALAVIDVDLVDAAGGRIRRTLSATESAKLVPGRAYWDLQLTNPGGFVRTYLAGPVTVVGDVSRA